MKLPPSPPARTRAKLRDRLRRVALFGLLGAFLLYAGLVTAGYVWLHHVRKHDQIGFLDVAFLRVQAVQRGLAVQQFAQAKQEWADRKYQGAYLAFSSALRNDPDNVAGRLEAARFFREVGAGKLSYSLLEDGLARAPEERRLIEPVFQQLLAAGREQRVLELLHRHYGSRYTGSNKALLQIYELQAKLVIEGAAAARKHLEAQPGLAEAAGAAPVVARVLWESAERLRAIDLLARHLRQHDAPYADYALLAGWQVAGGQPEDAVRTAQRACEKFPSDRPARVLLLEMHAAAAPDGRPGRREVEAYLKEFAGQQEPLALFATLTGRKGWVDLARMLYELAASSQPDLGHFALCYSDALAHNSRFAEVQEMLAQIEAQTAEGGAAFLLQLRVRQVIAAGALRDSVRLRELAQRLAASFRSNPDGLESYRRYFEKVGLTEVVEELSGRKPAAKPAIRNEST